MNSPEKSLHAGIKPKLTQYKDRGGSAPAPPEFIAFVSGKGGTRPQLQEKKTKLTPRLPRKPDEPLGSVSTVALSCSSVKPLYCTVDENPCQYCYSVTSKIVYKMGSTSTSNQAEQLAWLTAAKGFDCLGTLSSDDLFVLESLVACVKDQGADLSPAANDAGTETSYAMMYTKDTAETILLGVSGDERFENTDATAQALYLFLHTSFPGVTSYFGEPRMAPVGFQPVPLLDFCGYSGMELNGLQVERTDVDCEAQVEPPPHGQRSRGNLCAHSTVSRSRQAKLHRCHRREPDLHI